MSRPKEYTEEKIELINEKLLHYIEMTEIPILAEFAYKNNIRRATLYEHDGFTYARKKSIDKKEAQLEKLGLTGKVNPTMAIFALKQLGWKDKMEYSGELNVNQQLQKLSDEDIEKLLDKYKNITK